MNSRYQSSILAKITTRFNQYVTPTPRVHNIGPGRWHYEIVFYELARVKCRSPGGSRELLTPPPPALFNPARDSCQCVMPIFIVHTYSFDSESTDRLCRWRTTSETNKRKKNERERIVEKKGGGGECCTIRLFVSQHVFGLGSPNLFLERKTLGRSGDLQMSFIKFVEWSKKMYICRAGKDIWWFTDLGAFIVMRADRSWNSHGEFELIK